MFSKSLGFRNIGSTVQTIVWFVLKYIVFMGGINCVSKYSGDFTKSVLCDSEIVS
jgi:hypothetical protein